MGDERNVILYYYHDYLSKCNCSRKVMVLKDLSQRFTTMCGHFLATPSTYRLENRDMMKKRHDESNEGVIENNKEGTIRISFKI